MSRKRQEFFEIRPPANGGEDSDGDRPFVTALARGLEVLSCFRRSEMLLGNQDIAARCGLPKSTVSRLTYTLTKLGYLHYVEAVAKYRLGTAVLALGTSMLARLDVRNIARPLIEELAISSRVSSALGVRDRLSMVLIESFYGYTPVSSLYVEGGSRISISTSAMGRAFLAVCSEELRASILEEIRALDKLEWTRTSDVIAKAIEDHRTLGCTCSFGEWQSDVNAIAAAFNPGGGLPPMAINCGASDTVASPEYLLHEVRPKLLSVTRRLEGTMGL
jgi:DNA-binding IclR family transcriptional regulator